MCNSSPQLSPGGRTGSFEVRTIIAGSRKITDIRLVEEAVEKSGFDISCVISGTARGVDTLGEEWAAYRGIPIEYFPADWDGLGKRAGPLRNIKMAENADALIALMLMPETRGTKHMIGVAHQRYLRVFVLPVHLRIGP